MVDQTGDRASKISQTLPLSDPQNAQEPSRDLSFGSVLAGFAPATEPNSLYKTGLQAASAGDLRGKRNNVAEEIGKATREGNTNKLHQLQKEYEELTAQLRERAETAFAAQPAVASNASVPAPVPIPAPLSTQKSNGETKNAKTAAPVPVHPENVPKGNAQQETVKQTLNRVKQTLKQIEERQAQKLTDNPFGVSDTVWEQVCKNQQVRSALLSMPTDAVALYKQITPMEKKELSKHLNEKTHVLFFTIDNRQAFIDGKVMGRDTFDYMENAIDKQIDDGKISLEEALKQKSAINILRDLTPEQREGFVALVDREVGSGAN